MTESPEHHDSLLIKTIRIFDGQMLSFYVNGEAVNLAGLPPQFKSYEHLGEIISAYHLLKRCATVTEKSLIDFAQTTPRLSCKQNKYGHIESLDCKLLAQRGRQCVKCQNSTKIHPQTEKILQEA